jgi:hypothetical protein
VRGNV